MSRFRVLAGRSADGGSAAVTAPAGGLARVRAAVAVVAHEPSLWALGALSFAVRGGWLLLAVPIITFPGDGQLSTIFGPVLTTSGPSSGLAVLLAIAGVAALLLAGMAILLAAYADVAAFDRTVHSPETAELRAGRAPRELRGGERRGLVARVAGVQAVGLVGILAVAAVVGRRIPQIVVAELQFPSNATDSVITRVLGQIRGDLLVLAAVVVLVDIAVAILSRRLMARRFGLADGARPGAWKRGARPAAGRADGRGLLGRDRRRARSRPLGEWPGLGRGARPVPGTWRALRAGSGPGDADPRRVRGHVVRRFRDGRFGIRGSSRPLDDGLHPLIHKRCICAASVAPGQIDTSL